MVGRADFFHRGTGLVLKVKRSQSAACEHVMTDDVIQSNDALVFLHVAGSALGEQVLCWNAYICLQEMVVMCTSTPV